MHHYPPVRRRRQGKLFIGVVLAVIAVAGVGHLLYRDLAGEPGGAGSTPPSGDSAAAAAPASPQRPATSEPARAEGRTDTILSCTGPDGTPFFTNAARCEDADLDNRVNVVPAQAAGRPDPATCLGAQSGGRVHAFLSSCQEPFNQALALEPRLLEAEDPTASRSLRRYCDLVTEGVQSGCMATSAQFCFLPLCRGLRDGDGS